MASFHPDLHRIARFLPRSLVRPRLLPIIRALGRLARPRAFAGVAVENLATPASASGPPVRVRVYRPAGAPRPAPALLWIHGGTLDLFHDEDLAYAQRLNDSGVPCEVSVVPGAYHGFDIVSPTATVVRAFRSSYVAALRRALFPSE